MFSLLYEHWGKNGLFLMIANVYVTLKLQFKSCVLFLFIKYLEEDMESDICKLPATWRKVKAHWNRFWRAGAKIKKQSVC